MATKTGSKHDIPLGIGGGQTGIDGRPPCKIDIPIQKDVPPFGKGPDYPKGGTDTA